MEPIPGKKSFSFEDLRNEMLKELEFDSVLNKIKKYCVSEIAQEIIGDLKPTEDTGWLRNEHLLVSEMTGLMVEDDDLPISGLSDIRKKLQKTLVENSMLSSTEILSVLDVMQVIRRVKHFFVAREERYDHLRELSSNLFEDRIIEKHITECIKDDGEIRDNATRDLQTIRSRIHNKSQNLRTRLRKILRKVVEEDVAREDFFSIREGRFVLPVKTENKRHLPGIIHGLSNTGATVFIEPSEIIELNNELSLLKNEEEREMTKILMNLTAEIGKSAPVLNGSMDIMGHLDAIHAKARYALEYGGIKPEITDEPLISLGNIRHPLLVQSKGKDKVVPLSVEFNINDRGHLISGPNAGGKTVALKSIGINMAMALSGIFPLGECKTNYRSIFTSIGDHQSIENDLSTFSSQILQLKNILEICDKDSLVLIDEIGSGTDPQEGAALAAGILDTFIEINLFFVATTHQSSLKTYALNRDEIVNASLEFNEEKLIPTYNFLPGTPGNSYAFFLARSLGLSELVIKRAKKYLGKKQKELEESISILQKYRSEAIKIRVEAEQEKIKYKDLLGKYQDKIDKFNEKRDDYIKKARKEAADIVENANALIENTIKEVREKDKEKSFSKIKQEFQKEKDTIEKKAETLGEETDEFKEEAKKKDDPKEGDIVVMEGSSSEGTLVEMFDDGKSALVEFGGLKFKTPLKKLNKIRSAKPDDLKTGSSSKTPVSFEAQQRIDIRGYRADEAIDEVDRLISDAILTNLDFVTIVHGKGTGALRQVIHKYLKHHQSVTKFREGELVEGGSGVTIAYFNT